MSALPLGMTGAQSMMVVVEGVRALAGRQVVTLAEAWTALTGWSSDELDDEEAAAARWVLKELGYELQWVTELGRAKFLHRWTRGPWLIDFGANLTRKITPYVAN